MTAHELVARLRALNIRISLEESRVRVMPPAPGIVTADLWRELELNKEEIRTLLQQAKQDRKARAPITRVERGGRLPLSYAQQRLWFLAQMEGGSEAYHIPFALRLHGALNQAGLR